MTTTIKLLLLIAILIGITTVFLSSTTARYNAATYIQQQSSAKNRREKSRLPVAIYSAKLPDDPAERDLRLARSSHYDNRAPITFADMRPDTTGYSTNSHWWLGLPALPTAESDAVVIGKIVGANGYLSNDRTGAYSELTIRIKKVFKDDNRLSRGSIIAEREGADVQLPNGRIIRYAIAGQGIPQISGRYVLFLKYNQEVKAYDIITGYELSNGRVFPLDTAIERFTAYENSDEQTFLDAVKAAVSHPPQAPEDKREVSQ